MEQSGGRPVSIEVVHSERRRDLSADGGSPFELTREELVFRPSPATPLARLIDELPNFVRGLQRRYGAHNISVHWKTEGSEKTLRTAIEPRGRAEDLLQRAMTLSVRLADFSNPIPSAAETVNAVLVTRILEVLRSPPA